MIFCSFQSADSVLQPLRQGFRIAGWSHTVWEPRATPA
jgi:hypothetical protein